MILSMNLLVLCVVLLLNNAVSQQRSFLTEVATTEAELLEEEDYDSLRESHEEENGPRFVDNPIVRNSGRALKHPKFKKKLAAWRPSSLRHSKEGHNLLTKPRVRVSMNKKEDNEPTTEPVKNVVLEKSEDTNVEVKVTTEELGDKGLKIKNVETVEKTILEETKGLKKTGGASSSGTDEDNEEHETLTTGLGKITTETPVKTSGNAKANKTVTERIATTREPKNTQQASESGSKTNRFAGIKKSKGDPQETRDRGETTTEKSTKKIGPVRNKNTSKVIKKKHKGTIKIRPNTHKSANSDNVNNTSTVVPNGLSKKKPEIPDPADTKLEQPHGKKEIADVELQVKEHEEVKIKEKQILNEPSKLELNNKKTDKVEPDDNKKVGELNKPKGYTKHSGNEALEKEEELTDTTNSKKNKKHSLPEKREEEKVLDESKSGEKKTKVEERPEDQTEHFELEEDKVLNEPQKPMLSNKELDNEESTKVTTELEKSLSVELEEKKTLLAKKKTDGNKETEDPNNLKLYKKHNDHIDVGGEEALSPLTPEFNEENANQEPERRQHKQAEDVALNEKEEMGLPLKPRWDKKKVSEAISKLEVLKKLELNEKQQTDDVSLDKKDELAEPLKPKWNKKIYEALSKLKVLKEPELNREQPSDDVVFDKKDEPTELPKPKWSKKVSEAISKLKVLKEPELNRKQQSDDVTLDKKEELAEPLKPKWNKKISEAISKLKVLKGPELNMEQPSDDVVFDKKDEPTELPKPKWSKKVSEAISKLKVLKEPELNREQPSDDVTVDKKDELAEPLKPKWNKKISEAISKLKVLKEPELNREQPSDDVVFDKKDEPTELPKAKWSKKVSESISKVEVVKPPELSKKTADPIISDEEKHMDERIKSNPAIKETKSTASGSAELQQSNSSKLHNKHNDTVKPEKKKILHESQELKKTDELESGESDELEPPKERYYDSDESEEKEKPQRPAWDSDENLSGENKQSKSKYDQSKDPKTSKKSKWVLSTDKGKLPSKETVKGKSKERSSEFEEFSSEEEVSEEEVSEDNSEEEGSEDHSEEDYTANTTTNKDELVIDQDSEESEEASTTPTVKDRFYVPSPQLLEPLRSSDKMDVFRYTDNETDFTIIYSDLPWALAKRYCKEENAILGLLTTPNQAYFIAEALSEIDVNIDTVWVGGRQTVNNSWIWEKADEEIEFMTPNVARFFLNRTIDDIQRKKSKKCLAFSRRIHDQPLLVDLDCSLPRPFICQKTTALERSVGASTHNDWIDIKGRKYKIFYDKVRQSDASLKCFENEKKSNLAYIEDYETAQILGRFMMIGRPSLENAWIGLKWSEEIKSWLFTEQHIVIPDTIGANNYPPWRRTMRNKRSGCGLLDRHVSNETVFVEARCDRLRAYICMIPEDKTKQQYLRIDSRNNHYTFYLEQETWYKAAKICSTSGGKLAEPKSDLDVMNYIRIMGDNVTYTRHMWIGGRYKGNKWIRPSDNNPIANLNPEFWVANRTFYQSLEFMNTCLNLDREGHYTPLIYGTICEERQSFLCEFDKKVKTSTKNNETPTEKIKDAKKGKKKEHKGKYIKKTY